MVALPILLHDAVKHSDCPQQIYYETPNSFFYLLGKMDSLDILVNLVRSLIDLSVFVIFLHIAACRTKSKTQSDVTNSLKEWNNSDIWKTTLHNKIPFLKK